MEEEQVMKTWYTSGGIVCTQEMLVLALLILVKNGVSNVCLKHLGSNAWGIYKLY